MIFWIIIALVTAAVVIALSYPLLRAPTDVQAAPNSLQAAQAIYAAQMAELERDASQNLTLPAEAESAKAELARRLLRAAKDTKTASPENAAAFAPPRKLALTLSVLVPMSAVAIYLAIGNPDAPSQDASSRAAVKAERSKYQSLVNALEMALAAGKGDAEGWRLLVQAYRNLGDDKSAFAALKRGIDTMTKNTQPIPPEFWVGLGSGLVNEAQGTVTADARDAFNKVLAVDPKNISAQYFLGLERAQNADKSGALSLWTPLLAQLPPDSPQHTDLEKRINELSSTR